MRSALASRVVLARLASAAGVAIAAEPGKKKETRAVAPPMKPGPDGWYDASPPDGSFKVRIPGVYRGFSRGRHDATRAPSRTPSACGPTSAPRSAAQTSYAASCIQQKGDTRTRRSGSRR